MDTTFIFLLTAVIIIIGFMGDRFFKRTAVAPFLFLILVGILLGPVFHILSRDAFLPILGVFGVLTLMMILFYGGMDTRLAGLTAGGGRAFFQVVLYVVPSTIIIGVTLSFLLHWNLIESMIFASMVGGETTAVVVIPLSKSLNLSKATADFLLLESAVNTIFSVILFFSLVSLYQTGVINVSSIVSLVASNFSVSIVVGIVLSLVWLRVLQKYSTQKYTYVLTLGLLLLTYVITNNLGGNGALGSLVFGMVIGNYEAVGRATGKRFDMSALLQRLKMFQEEIAFLMETLFFVFLGLTILLNFQNLLLSILVGMVVLGILFAIRYLAVTISTHKSPMAAESQTILFFMAQGLTPATLSILAYNMGLPLSNTYLVLVTFVIIFTNVVTTVGTYMKGKEKDQGFRNFMLNLGDGADRKKAEQASEQG